MGQTGGERSMKLCACWGEIAKNIPRKTPGAIEQLQMKRRRGLAVDLPAGGGLRGHYVLLPRAPSK